MAEKMNPEVKAKWVAALRSGEYGQCDSKLKDGAGGFCCLGVLCDLYAKAHAIHAWESNDLGMEGAELPNRAVRAWAQLTVENPMVLVEGDNAYLTALNDGGFNIARRTFAQIADEIEAQL